MIMLKRMKPFTVFADIKERVSSLQQNCSIKCEFATLLLRNSLWAKTASPARFKPISTFFGKGRINVLNPMHKFWEIVSWSTMMICIEQIWSIKPTPSWYFLGPKSRDKKMIWHVMWLSWVIIWWVGYSWKAHFCSNKLWGIRLWRWWNSYRK